MVKLIYNGNEYENEIVSATLDMKHSMVGETLSVDSLYLPIIHGDLPERFIAVDQGEDDWLVTADGYELCAKPEPVTPEFNANAPGTFFHNNILIAKYFLHALQQIGKYEYAFTLYSAIRLLDQTKHLGGLYSGDAAGDVLADIMGGVPYTVDSDITTLQIYGYLPFSTRRNNLQMFLMATGAAVRNAADGTLRITKLSEIETGTFGKDRVFIGAIVEDKIPCTAVQVTEHNFIESAEEVTLYESSSITTETIYFSEPYHDYSITNGAIIESGVNHVKFTGAGLVTIKGKKYVHIKRIITHGTTPTDSVDDVVKSVTSNTLINPYNAVDIAQRLFDYLSVAKSIRAEVVFGSERPGDVVNVVHPYTEQLVKATLKSMSPISVGRSELRAMSEFLVGYTPPSLISGFTHHVLLTGSGTWEVPEGVTKIRVALFGAGDGGSGGYDGEDGTPAESSSGGPGEGGSGGVNGSGGLIFELNLTVTPGAPFDFVCGTGGDGGAKGNPGLAGGDTTFGIYSSALGRFYPDGYQEPKTGLTLGADGDPGLAGGRGSAFQTAWPSWENDVTIPGPSIVYKGVTFTPGANGANEISLTYNTYGFGGRGGGAAAGANGGNGGNITIAYVSTYGSYVPTGGSGGNGADAVDADDAANYGQGGHGGHGGGGGGHNLKYPSSYPGQGGSGSAGGKGGDGCIVIYY